MDRGKMLWKLDALMMGNRLAAGKAARYLLAGAFLLHLLTQVAAAADRVRVVATIPPLHSLVQSVLGETANADLLLEQNATPHSFQLKPSQVRQLIDADIVFYISDDMETPLLRAFENLSATTLKVAMLEQRGIRKFSIRENEDWESHVTQRENNGRGAEAAHDHSHGDPHIWLSPDNAVAMIKAITRSLSAVNPAGRAIYKRNAIASIAAIGAAEKRVGTILSPVKATPYVVFHDAYQYFEFHFGLNPIGSIVIDPELGASAKRMVEIRAKIKRKGAVCVFREPQFSTKLSEVAASGSGAKLAVLDPLGSQLPTGAALYTLLLDDLAQKLSDCLSH